MNAAIELLKGALEWVRNPAAVEELIAYLEKRRAYIPNYQQRQRAGLWIASTRVEKYNDWAVSARCKRQGMSWSPQGVLALARWKPRGGTVNSTLGVGTVSSRSIGYRNRFARPLDRGTGHQLAGAGVFCSIRASECPKRRAITRLSIFCRLIAYDAKRCRVPYSMTPRITPASPAGGVMGEYDGKQAVGRISSDPIPDALQPSVFPS